VPVPVPAAVPVPVPVDVEVVVDVEVLVGVRVLVPLSSSPQPGKNGMQTNATTASTHISFFRCTFRLLPSEFQK